MTLRELVKEKGLRKTARRLGISPALLNYYLNTKKIPSHLIRGLAESLDIQVEKLLELIEKEYRLKKEKK